jgi:enamine deaminase RidA (YjgF/YER057c/UK114 family)
MQREAINPWGWSLPLGYNQAEVISGARRQLTCAGQTAMDASGQPQFPGDMRGQLGLVLDNIAAVLAAAGMGLGNITGMTVYATDVDAALANFDLLGMRFGPIGAAPPMTLVGVSRLAIPPLMIEITVTAAD